MQLWSVVPLMRVCYEQIYNMNNPKYPLPLSIRPVPLPRDILHDLTTALGDGFDHIPYPIEPLLAVQLSVAQHYRCEGLKAMSDVRHNLPNDQMHFTVIRQQKDLAR